MRVVVDTSVATCGNTPRCVTKPVLNRWPSRGATMRLMLVVLGILVVNTGARAEERVLFETHILPILKTRCLKCHGDPKVQGGLDLRRKFTLVRGGDSGSAIVPGKPAESILFQKIDKNEM